MKTNPKTGKTGFLILLGIYSLLFLVDAITTLLAPNYQYLEANPIFALTGTILAPIGFNLLVIAVLVWAYPRTTIFFRFAYMAMMTITSYLRIDCIKTAIDYIKNPVTVEWAITNITPAAKVATIKAIANFSLVAFALALVAFAFWKLDHKVEKK